MKRLLLATLSLWLCACGPIPTTPEDSLATASALTYFKDSYGICYASVTSYTQNMYRTVSIASVPCKAVGLQ